MKFSRLVLISGIALLFLSVQGFQCGSPEFTGAKVQIQQKNYKEAIRLLEIEVKKNPDNDEAWYLLGALRADEGDYAGMNTAFDEALKLSNKHEADIHNERYRQWGRHLNAGVDYLNRASADSTQYYDRAIEQFDTASTIWPDTSLTFRYLGYAYNNKGDFDKALQAFLKAWDAGKDYESLMRACRIYVDRGTKLKDAFKSDNAEALSIQKSLADIRKGSYKADVTKALGAPDNIKKGPRGSKKEDWIYRNYNLTVAFDNDKVVRKSFSQPYVPKIDSTKYYLAVKEFDKAITELQKIRRGDPEDSDALNLMLNAYVAADRIKEAATVFKEAVERHPENKTNHYIYGVLLRTIGDFQAAIDQFKEAYDLDPSYTDALFDLGATYYNWGVDLLHEAQDKGEVTDEHKEKFKEALPYMERVSEEKPDDPMVWETLGTIYAQLGEPGMKEKAIEAFDKADALRSGKSTPTP